jgi:hypothetical protein
MNEAVALLRDKLAKADSKVSRAEKALEAARTERDDLQTALRVMESLTGATSAATVATASTADRQQAIAELLGVGRERAKAPADMYPAYKELSGEHLSIDTFRTTIWRMKGKSYPIGDETYFVIGEEGAYWREREPVLSDRFDELLGGDAQKENEPLSEDADGSDAADWGAPTPSSAWSNTQTTDIEW